MNLLNYHVLIYLNKMVRILHNYTKCSISQPATFRCFNNSTIWPYHNNLNKKICPIGVHRFGTFFGNFRFWRFRHPYKTLWLYLKSPRFFKNLSFSALIFSVTVLIVSFSAPTVSVSAQKQQMFSSLQAFLLYTLFRPLMALAVWVLFPAPPPPCDVYCLSWLSRC